MYENEFGMNGDAIIPEDFLTDWDRKVLEVLSVLGPYLSWELPDTSNPITDALAQGDQYMPNLMVEYEHPKDGLLHRLRRTGGTVLDVLEMEDWFDTKQSYFRLSRLATLCQMKVYNRQGGPEGDGKPKALRRHWYHWFKTRFAQPFAAQIEAVTGNKPSEGKWDARMSDVYGSLVDEGATYYGLWVDDASRMREKTWQKLFSTCHILFAVEKDSLFDDFKPVAASIGATSITSGKGVNSRASAEKIMREHFGWRSDYDPFSEDAPLIVLHISDHDYSGEAVIGPTFGEQCRRYTPHVLEARVGIKPNHVERGEWQDKWYEVKTNNQGFVEWCEREGLFLTDCWHCGTQYVVHGTGMRTSEHCPVCSEYQDELHVKIDGEIVDVPHGFEVEALPTRAYYSLAVDALLRILPYEMVLEHLRRECVADHYQAAERVRDDILEENEDYQAIVAYLAEYERVVGIKEQFEQVILNRFSELGEPHVGDWEDEEDDPDVGGFVDHVTTARDYTGAWRPFSGVLRTGKLVEFLEDEYDLEVDDFKAQRIEWQ